MNTAQKTLCLDTASTIAYNICRDAIWENDSCNWIGSTNEEYLGMPKVYARSMQSNFYDGTAGVAFFLTQLVKVNDDRILKETAEASLNQLLKAADSENEETFGKLGFHTGYTGEAWVLIQAAEIMKNKKYREAAIGLIEKLINLPASSWSLDMIDGAAGAIPCLITLYKYYPEKKLKSFIVALGEYLKKNTIVNANQAAWDTMGGASKPLTGFGHGAAGISSSLFELAAFTGNQEYLELGAKGFNYEDHHFNHQHQNWPDFRAQPPGYPVNPAQQEENCGIAWCHGAPGIALSRLRAYELTGSAQWKKDAETAVNTTAKHFGFDSLGNYSLCHGLFGNAETLLYAAEVLENNELNILVEKATVQALEQTFSRNNPVANGLHNFYDTPDFMLGTSGMGYFFLRMYDPKMFSSALMLKAA